MWDVEWDSNAIWNLPKIFFKQCLTEFLPYPRKYLGTVSNSNATETCPTVVYYAMKFGYKNEHAKIFYKLDQIGIHSLA